jgi:signal transduction histidine kinase
MSPNFSFTLDNKVILEGNILTLVLVAFILLVIIIATVVTIWHKLRENEDLKYEFITIIAHKFRTPLTHLKWILEGMFTTTQDASTRENLSDMKQSTDHLINLTGTLIELTNTDNEAQSSYKLERLSVSDLVREVAAAFKDMFHEKNILFSAQSATEGIMANIDRPRMEFVLQTLLENSYAYTPPGLVVEMSTTIEGKKAVISVTDNGIGIDPKDLPNIFGKFYRGKNARETDPEGFGVGLFMAKEIVRHHKGKIEVYSAGKNHGATFRVILPLVK